MLWKWVKTLGWDVTLIFTETNTEISMADEDLAIGQETHVLIERQANG